MTATKKAISAWFVQGVNMKEAFMLIVCDGFENDDYPVYARDEKELKRKADDLHGRNMQRVMESYDLSKDLETQLAEDRAWHGWVAPKLDVM